MVNQSRPPASPGIEDREDVRVLEPGGEADLALEPVGAERGGQLGVQHLERDRAVVLEVLGQVDRGHAAAPELAVERVAVGQALPQSSLQFTHAGLQVRVVSSQSGRRVGGAPHMRSHR